MSFTVATYNMGANIYDYLALRGHTDGFTPNAELANKPEYHSDYAKAEEAVAVNFTDNAYNSSFDVYCLQEVGSEDRPLIKRLKSAFTIVHLEGHEGAVFDTAIALKNRRFEAITNHSFLAKTSNSGYTTSDLAVVTAIDKKTGEKVAFVSAHVPGFDFAQKGPMVERDVISGNIYCQEIVKNSQNLVCAQFK